MPDSENKVLSKKRNAIKSSIFFFQNLSQSNTC